MKVRSLVGRFAGQVIDVSYVIGTSMLANGTAVHPDAEVNNVRGMKIGGTPDAGLDRMVTSQDMVTETAPRRGRPRRK